MIKKASWLKKNLNKKNIKIIDASWYLPGINRDAHKEYKNSHIENALFFDIDRICDKETYLPHMLLKILFRKLKQLRNYLMMNYH